MTDHPIPAPAMWGKTTAQKLTEKQAFIPLGCDQQGRLVPTTARRQLAYEDSTGMCDTCPGELDMPEAVYQAEPAGPPPMHWRDLGLMAAVAVVALVSAHFWAAS